MRILRDSITKEFIARSTREDGFIPEASEHSGSEYVEIVRVPKSDYDGQYDTATQKLISNISETNDSGTFDNPVIQTQDWAIVNMTQEEIDEIEDSAERDAYKSFLSSAPAALENWATEFESQTITAVNMEQALRVVINNRLPTLFRALSRLIKFLRADL